MKKTGYYSSGQFAKMAQITLRTVRFYDKKGLLKPSYIAESGARFYTDNDVVKLQQILLLKYLGFSLDDIKEMIIDDSNYKFLLNSLKTQLHLIQDKIEQLHLVEKAIQDTTEAITLEKKVNWDQMLKLIHLTTMETSMKLQYKNASNLSARINLHHLYSTNKQGWFPWIFSQCELTPGMNVLEVGCGDGSLWLDNHSSIPTDLSINLSDISEGMLRDARRAIGLEDHRFTYNVFDCQDIPYEDETFDLVIANHVLFYCNNIARVCSEVRRVLKPGGKFICSTYGNQHMTEITHLVQTFDSRIQLATEDLFNHFGLQNGEQYLRNHFSFVIQKTYEDSLYVTEAEPLISYILSCHGNQNQYLLNHYSDFKEYVKSQVSPGFHVTKQAGIFICTK